MPHLALAPAASGSAAVAAVAAVALRRLSRAGLMLVFATACGPRARSARPQASLSASLDAQRDFAGIRDAWNDPRLLEVGELRKRLEAFLAKFPNDGLSPLARVYLAFVCLEMGDDARAAQVLAPLDTMRNGATRDLATVARAKLLRRAGQPSEAFELLRPLLGKLVDQQARTVFGEEVTLAAFQSHHDYEAMAYMDAWLRATSEEERERVRQKIERILAATEKTVVLATLRTMREDSARGGYSAELERLVTERLATIAVQKSDADLARWIVRGSASPLPSDPGRESLGELATRPSSENRVDGRTIGLLLPTRDLRLQDESAEVIRGVAWALDLPRRDPRSGDHVRLVTRDTPTGGAAIEPRLDELAGEGVAVVITGLDPATAGSAIRWSNTRKIPVILLSAQTTPGGPGAYGFEMGEPTRSSVEALVAALRERKIASVAPVGERLADVDVGFIDSLSPLFPATPGACDGDVQAPGSIGSSPLPVTKWRTERVRAWVVAAPSDCVDKVLRVIPEGFLATTLDGIPKDNPPARVRVLAAAAGVLPVLPRGAGAHALAAPGEGPSTAPLETPAPLPTAILGDARLADVAAFSEQLGRAPDWWTALGRDAGVLARKAASALPDDATSTDAEAQRRREAFRTGFVDARAPLWTSEAQGFGSNHVLPRTVSVVELGHTWRDRHEGGRTRTQPPPGF